MADMEIFYDGLIIINLYNRKFGHTNNAHNNHKIQIRIVWNWKQ